MAKTKHDVVILALTLNDNLFLMTKKCIDSLRESEPNIDFNVILVESNKENAIVYRGLADVIVTPDEVFNYNKYMNIGMKHAKSQWISLCNNDLIFLPNWATTMYEYHKLNPDVKSYGHWNDYVNWHPTRMAGVAESYEGYEIGKHVSGWCISAKKEVFKTINLDDRVDFWFSDNIYADELKQHGYRHVLLRNSKILHVESQTSKVCPVKYGFYEQQDKYKGTTMRIDLGCGRKKKAGYYGIDCQQLEGVDLVCDCNGKIPLPDSCADEINASDFLEHINNDKRIHIMTEIWRILKNGGTLIANTPSTDGRGAFQDPTHFSFWNENSFLYYTQDDYRLLYGITPKFDIVKLHTTPMLPNGVCYVYCELRAVK